MKGKFLQSVLLVLMKLTADQIAEATNGKILRKHQDAFESFSIDSRKMIEGGLFFAMKGENTDGHLFLQDAFRNGAGDSRTPAG